jgi:uncharacterized protein YfaS (alpha-2-macroglobulin family)
MFSNKFPRLPLRWWVWGLALMSMLLLAGVGIALEKPVGSLGGRISLEESGFNLETYDLRGRKVYAMAIGPREGTPVERGVWVQPDGTFRIDQLPQGEYSLRVRAPGFETYNESGLFVEEGRLTTLAESISMHVIHPYISVGAPSRVFTTQEQPSFWLNASGGDKVTVKVYRYDMKQALLQGHIGSEKELSFSYDLSLYKPSSNQKATFLDGLKPVQELKRTLTLDQEDWGRSDVKLDKPLPPGDYVVVTQLQGFRDQTDWNLTWFTVTDIGLVVKHAPDKTWVRAIDLNTQAPRPGVAVAFYDGKGNQQPLGQAQTGSDGVATYQHPAGLEKTRYYRILAIGEKDNQRAYSGIQFWRDRSEVYNTYFYTERPVYRLGQSVYFRGIMRKLEKDGFHNPKANVPVQLQIFSPDNEKLWEGTVRTSAHGSFHGVYDVPQNGSIGAYQVMMTYPDQSTAYGYFEVAQYRKPEYQVEVKPLTPRVTAGSEFEARVRASYYFGGPVPNARVKYTVYANNDWATRYRLMPRPDYYDFFDTWEGSEGHSDYGYAGDYITEGYAQTDENGEVTLKIPTRKLSLPSEGPFGQERLDKRYKVEVEVTDLSRMTVTGSGYAQVTAGDFALFIQSPRSIYRAGQSLAVDITALDYDGAPVANQAVEVSLMRWVWNSRTQSYQAIQAEQPQTVQTNAEGRTEVHYSLAGALPSDTYYMTAKAKDSHQHLISDEQAIWITSDQAPYRAEDNQADEHVFSIKLDKSVYQPGETAQVLITAPVTGKEGAQAIVAVEGTTMHEVRLVPMTATAQVVKIPITERYSPNVYVTGTFVGKGHQFYNQSVMMKVSPDKHFLNIAVTTDREKYAPGDEVTYTVQATYPDGRPAPDTELSLGVVDESIYAIRPDSVRDIQRFFYRQRSNWVTTTSSFPEQYSGGPDKVEPRVRKDFRDMAAWFPQLLTDAQGLARVTVRLPDNLTTWRATVRGITMGTDVGSAIQKIVSTQDFLVRLALPRFFTEGDVAAVTAVVHNDTDQPQDVQLTLAMPEVLSSEQALVQSLQVLPNKIARFTWPVEVLQPAAGSATFTLKAVGQKVGDAVEWSRPIYPLGLQVMKSKSGVLTSDPASYDFNFSLPRNARKEAALFRLGLAPSSIGPVLGNLSQLVDYPYGCTEQTMSRLIPDVIIRKLHSAMGVQLNAETQKRFDKVYRDALKKLYQTQNPDGGWGWWSNDSSNLYLSAYVMEGFHLLKASGAYEFQDKLIQRGKKWIKESEQSLLKQLTDEKLASDPAVVQAAWTDLAYANYVLSLYGESVPTRSKAAFLEASHQLSPQALAWMLLALNPKTDQHEIRQLDSLLMGLSNQTEGQLDWSLSPQTRKRLMGVGSDYRFTSVEVTALAMRALLERSAEVTPAAVNRQRVEATKTWLLSQRDQHGWQNTKTTAQVLRALVDEELAHHQEAEATEMEARLLLDDTAQETVHFSKQTQYQKETLLELPWKSLADGIVRLSKAGPGRLYFSGMLSYWLSLKPGEVFEHEALPSGLTIRRGFYRLEPSAVTRDGTIRFRSRPLGNQPVKAGETLLMKIEVESPVALPYLILNAPLPSGGEVPESTVKRNLLETQEESGIEGDWEITWWSHEQVLDDRVVFFTHQLPARQKNVFHTLVRMELPGTFQLNPVRLEGMYTDAIQAASKLDTLKVVE